MNKASLFIQYIITSIYGLGYTLSTWVFEDFKDALDAFHSQLTQGDCSSITLNKRSIGPDGGTIYVPVIQYYRDADAMQSASDIKGGNDLCDSDN